MRELLLIILLFTLVNTFAESKAPCCNIIPPYGKNRINYRHTFPFELLENEKIEDAVVRVFYDILLYKIKKLTDMKTIAVGEPDAYPYYAQLRPEDEDDFARFVEIPSSKFSFEFNKIIPSVVIQIDSLHIYSSSSNSTDMGGMVGGLVGKAIDNAACDGDFRIDFKFMIWDNIKQEVIKIGYCETDEYSENPTVEEWDDILNEVMSELFYGSEIKVAN